MNDGKDHWHEPLVNLYDNNDSLESIQVYGYMEKQIQLKGGRKLGFFQYGDIKGTPVFYFHGWPASRLSAAIYDDVAKKFHVRIISPDRPGFGLSEYKKDRTLMDWPDDVVALADHLKIKTFAVMGVSGGAPYAAVCGYAIPHRITRLGIIVGLAPILGDSSLEGILWLSKMGWKYYGRFSIVRRIAAYIQYISVQSDILLRLKKFAWGKVDRQLLSDPKLNERANLAGKDAFRQGYKGPELDLKLYTTDWKFDLKDIRAKVYLWYGRDDQNVSLNMGKYYASQISKSTLKIYPGEGHLISVTHAEEILKTLTT